MSIQKARYQVDKDGYLMDGEGKYLLTENNQMICLNEEQINALMNS
jgi:flagellar basal body rod protein FlgG